MLRKPPCDASVSRGTLCGTLEGAWFGLDRHNLSQGFALAAKPRNRHYVVEGFVVFLLAVLYSLLEAFETQKRLFEMRGRVQAQVDILRECLSLQVG